MKDKVNLLHFLLILAFSLIGALGQSNLYAENLNSTQKHRELLVEEYNRTPNEYEPNIKLGYLYLVTGKYENSLFHYRLALKARSGDYSAMLGIGDAYSFLGKYRKSIKIYSYLRKVHSEKMWAYLHLGRLYLYLKDYSRALSVISEGILNCQNQDELIRLQVYINKVQN